MENTLSKYESNGPLLWIVNGRAQEGKTTKAVQILKAYKGTRRLYVDPNEKVKEGTVIKDIESLSYFIYQKDRKSQPWTITYYPETDELPEELDQIAGALMDWEKPFILVIDEFFNFSRTGHKLCQKLVRLIRVRAKFPAVIVLVSHRPTDIPPAYISTVNRWITFRQTYKPDVERIKADTGCINVDLIQRLKAHHFALWRGRELEFFDHRDQAIHLDVDTAPRQDLSAGQAEPATFNKGTDSKS